MADLGTAVLIADGPSLHLRPAVVLAPADEGLTVVPVSAEVTMATEWDLLLDASVFGYAAMAEVWNYGTVLPEQVHETVRPLLSNLYEQLAGLTRAASGRGSRPDAPVGPPVLEDADPRLLFQDDEGEALRGFWRPALMLAGALSLGEVVRHRREELALAVEALELPADWVEDLEHDKLYLPWALSPERLAGLMRALRVGASRRLGSITRSTLEVMQPALPRGAGARPPAGAASPDAYVEDFLRALKEHD